ncbi:Concanavalin A-like lectin/glucanase, subgroup [Artemisia annua]|uniref:RING-type E3 ubiquitin transferase n=1 Tax=Artemisia annua TaxID=35608 RepID=A0A2U1NYR3_ARTAN|nr:Concanavalin A-like lectin/glucanase, subgroup [Artemisia annua]
MTTPPMHTIAIGIDNDKHSPYAVQYALDNLVLDNSSINLVHVKLTRWDSPSSILPFGNGKYESNDSTIQQLFIRYGALCARKQIQVTNVLLIDADVSKALVDYVNENEIENLVLGASTRSGITRFSLSAFLVGSFSGRTICGKPFTNGKFKNSHVGSSVMKRVPDFCSVHIISKGRVLERRLATRTLVNLSAPPKILLSSELEDGNRSAAISQRSAPDMTMPHKRDVYETPAPVTFGSVHLVGHNLDVNFVGDSNENRTSASLSPNDLEAEMKRLKLELKQTMDMYNAAREEAIAAKKELCSFLLAGKDQPPPLDIFRKAAICCSGMTTPPMHTIAIGIDNDKHSPYAVQYALDNLVLDNSSINLVHVKLTRWDSPSSILPFGNGKYESNDSTIQQLFIRYGALCARKQIQVTNVLLIDADVSKALVDYVNENEIENLVLGASTRSGITRKFKNSHVGSSVMKRVPDFCSVHIISKGRVLERRLATRTLVNLSAPPKILLSSELEDGNRSAAISQRSAPDMTMPHKRDVYESPDPVTFGSVHLVGHNLDVNFVGDSNENRTSASLSPNDLEAEMKRLKLELKQTMDMYNAAREEAIAAKKEALELHQLQAAEQERLAGGVETKAIDKSKKLAEIEAQRRNQALYRKYTIEEIKEGTNNFERSLKIGEGGYGPVFKAKLDHTPVAIKVLRPDAKQGKEQFQQEVDILSRMRHPNLVLLLGACPEYGCLIYEFMNYGSLEDRLIRRNNTPPIPWQIRFNIAADIATGLLFLHQAKPEPLVHRDLKPGNILLDHNYLQEPFVTLILSINKRAS